MHLADSYLFMCRKKLTALNSTRTIDNFNILKLLCFNNIIMSTFVSGPINTVRLEGQIGNINKVLYLFFDFHASMTHQTECENIRSIELKDYLIKNFDITKSKIDFFLEIDTIDGAFDDEYYSGHRMKERRIYINNLRKFFKQNFNYDKKINKVYESKEFPNTRLHYIDFRDLFMNDISFTRMPNIRNYFMNNCWNPIYIDEQDIHFMRQEFKYIDNRMKFLKEYIFSKAKFEGKKSYRIELFEKMINKIKNIYHNKEIHDKIKKYFEDVLLTVFKKYEKKFMDFFEYLNLLEIEIKDKSNKLNKSGSGYGIDKRKLTKEYLPTILEFINDIHTYVEDMGLLIMDTYFLRRFLDKSYITNALVYTGAAHSCNYLYFLVKYCDFKITHTSYIKVPSKELHNIIKSSKHYEELKKYVLPQELYQCSDLTGFPERFT